MLALLTGATGLIGPYVLKRLVARGDSVRVLALPDTVEKVSKHSQVEVVAGSLMDEALLAEAAKGVDVVYHLGALLTSDLHELIRVNVYGTENLLNASTGGGVGRFVFTSSVAVYHSAPRRSMWPLTEDSEIQAHGGATLRNYGQSKIDGEKLLLRYHRQHGLETVILRSPTVYGPEAEWFRELIEAYRRNPWQAMTPEARARNMQWVYVEDLADGIVLAGTRPEAANQVFNIAGAEVAARQEIVFALWRASGGAGSWRMRRQSPERGDGRETLKYDIGKARRLLGFSPKVTLAEGVERTVGPVLAGEERRPGWMAYGMPRNAGYGWW